MTVYDLPHMTVRAVGDPVRLYRVTMEDGYWIHKPSFGENVWKTATSIYPDEDLTVIEIRATADLPEDAELLGGVDNDPELVTE